MKRNNIRKRLRSIMSLLMVVVLLATTLGSNTLITEASVSDSKGNASHIDIGVKASASVTVGDTTYSNSSIGITSTDFTSSTVTITAVQGTTTLTGSSDSSDWRRTGNSGNYTYTITDSTVDFVYNLSDLSTSSGNSGISQVRIGGCFPVGTKTNPVKYTVTLTKTVRLYAGGDTTSSDYIDLPMTLTATFGYWDTGNDCPPVTQSSSSWNNGNFINGSGLDFVLEASSGFISITKVVEDEDGNLITEASGQSFGYSVTSGGDTSTGSITVGTSGAGAVAIDVSDSSNFTVSETSYPTTISTSDGTYEYVKTTITYSGATATITNVYGIPDTSVTVTKEWDDAAYTGNRPTEVTVNLLANGDPALDNSNNPITATLNSTNNWTHTFTDLPTTSNGSAIEYSVEEVMVNDDYYTSSITGDATNGYTITNTLKVGSLTLSKAVTADSNVDTSGMTFTIYVKGNNGELNNVQSVTDSSNNTWSVSGGVATILVPAGGSITLVDLPVGSYTVYETDGTTDTTITANGYTWNISGDEDATVTVSADSTASAEVTNTVQYTGTIQVVKNWDDLSDTYGTRPDSITVTLTGTGTDGKTYGPYSYTADKDDLTSTDVWEFSIDGVEFFDDNGVAITYTVAETLTYAGTDYSKYYTTEYSATDITPGQYISENRNLTITNTLDTGSVTVTKTVETADGSASTDVFTIALVAYTYDDVTGTYTAATDAGGSAIVYTHTVSAELGWSYTFTDLPLGYYWSVSEWSTNSDTVYSYDMSLSVDGVAVSSSDITKTVNSNNNRWTSTYRYLELDSTTEVAIAMTNTQETVSVDLSTFLQGTKTLTGDPGEALTFTYTVTSGGETVATGTATVSASNNTSAITWTYVDDSIFTYTETGTYNYVITEDVSNAAGIVYDSTRYTLTVTVDEDATDGHLVATATMTKNVEKTDGSGERETTDATSHNGNSSITVGDYSTPLTITDYFSADFNNIYDADETSIIFRARKTLNGRTLQTGEFSVNVTEYTDDTYTTTDDVDGDGYTTITRENGADGNMGFEVVYKTAGTYYYTVTENSGTKNNVEYDTSTTYYIKVEVETVGSGTIADPYVLQVTSATYTTDLQNGTWSSLYDSSGSVIYFSFTNTYTDTVTIGLDNIVSKELTGRTLVADEFTFLLVPEGTAGNSVVPASATVATADDPYVTVGYVTAGQWYIEATNAADGSIDFGSITYTQDQVGTYTYKVIEVAGDLNGVTYDTGTTGKLIYVTVSYDSAADDLVVTYSTTSSDNKTVTISNTFDRGSISLYGTKVWVDGSQTHDNASEITLAVYTWNYVTEQWDVVNDSTYTVTWYTNGDWHIGGTGITKYDAYGNVSLYMVEETSVQGNYVTTYTADPSDSSAEPTDEAVQVPSNNSADNRYTITNTIEQEEVFLNGTKTWVDDAADIHDNEKEITLIVTRNSDSTTVETLTQASGNGSFNSKGDPVDGTYIVVWDGDDYAIYWYYDTSAEKYVGLPKYDDEGYTYSYSVAEDDIEGTTKSGESFTYQTETEFIDDSTNNTYTFNFTNRQPDETPTDPVKTVDTENTAGTDNDGEKVSVGETVTYTISYHNYKNTAADITITDVLDNGVTFVSATPAGSYTFTGESTGTDSNGDTLNYGGTIVWTIEDVEPFADGTVTLTVTVNENAREHDSGESGADIDNQATMTIAENDYYTEIITNPLTDDDPEDSVKAVSQVIEVTEENGSYTYTEQTATDGNGNIIVAVGDYVYYTVSAYNHYATGATVTITDVLDEGVDYVWSTQGSEYNSATHTVTGTYETNAFTWVTITICVQVNETAKTTAQTYEAVDPNDTSSEYTDYTYTDIASIANQATVTITNTSGESVTSYTDVPENPLPGKQVYDADDTSVDGDMVGVGDTLTYTIDWINSAKDTDTNSGTYGEAVAATITITDDIPEGTVYVEGSAESTITYTAADNTVNKESNVATITLYDADGVLYQIRYTNGTGTWYDSQGEVLTIFPEDYAASVTKIVWTFTNAPAGATGTVSFSVEVTDDAVDNTDNAVTNDADVVVVKNDYEYSYTTNTTTNYVPEKDVYDAEQYVEAAADDNVEAISIDGDLVGLDDVLLYTIDWQNTETTDADITITDEIPNGTDYVYGSATSKATVDGQTKFTVTLYDSEGNELEDTEANAGNVAKIVWTFTAEAGLSGTVTFEVEVTEGAFELESIDNTATVAIGENEYTTNTVTNTVPTKTAEVLTTDSDELQEGDVVEYTIDFVNTAEPSFDQSNPTKVVVTDTLTKGISYNEDADITVNGTVYTDATLDIDEDSEGRQVLTWTFEELELDAEVVITFSITVGSDAPSHITNQAAVDGHKTNIVISPVPSDDEKNVLDEDNQIIDGGNVSAGDVLTYEISWTNAVKDAITGEDTGVYADTVTIVDTLPDGIKVDTSTISHQGVYEETTDPLTGEVTRTITWTFTDLDTTDIERGTVWFEATVTGEETVMENTAIINEYEVSVTVYMPQKDVTDANDSTGISIDGKTVKVGDELSYEITVINTAMDGSDYVEADVTVVDYIPDGTVFVPGTAGSTLTANGVTTAGAATVRYFDANDNEITTVTADNAADVEYIKWTFTDMPANATGTVSFNVTVTEAALSNAGYAVTNDATLIIYDNEYTTNTVINKVTEKDVSYADDADQTSVDGELIGVGSELEYAVYWVNTATDEEGSAAATITITDDIPDGTEYAGSVSAYLEDGTDITTSVEITLYTLNETTGDYEVTDGTDTTLVDRIVWVIDADADAAGTVTFTVTVTEDAVTNESNEINNTASVVILLDNVAVVTYDTNTTTNYVPEKDVYDAEQYVDAMTSTEDEVEPESIDGEGVEIGDELTYEITFLNTAKDENGDYVAAETITVTDIIPTGTTYVAGSAAYADVAKDVTIQFYADTAMTTLLAETDVDDETTYYDVTTGDVLAEAPEDFAETVKAIAWVFTEVDAETEVTVSFNVIVTAEAADNDDNAVENYATVKIQVDDNDPGVDVTTNTVINYVPEDPEKVEVTITAEDETTEDAAAVTTDEDGNITYQSVSVGDTILYEIDYYNHYATEATVVITDTLEAGLTYVEGSATGVEKSAAAADDKIVYEVTEEDGIVTITWTITVEAFAEGSVTFEATVNDTAKLLGENETQATVENEATVEVGEVSRTTNLTINPLKDDDPDDPTKTVSANSPSGYDADAEIVYDDTDDTDAGTLTGDTVGVGSMIEYVISYYNNHSATATVTITDVLDEGVNFLSASGTTTVPDDTSVEAIGYDYVTYSYSEADHTVTWTIYNATAFAYGEAILVVQVNENAKTVEAGETTAAVENDASVQIGTDNAVDTNIVVNPIDPDDPGDPEKIVAADSAAGVNGAAVAVDDEITYQITYYNHTNTAADITITDVLDPGVEFVSATVADGISCNVTTATDGIVTVTWTITDVTAYTGGYVELVVKVTEDALSIVNGETVATVENQATVTVGDVSNDTNIVINPLEDDDPVDPTKTITTEGVAAGDEVAVGDELTYTITYYNHTNEVTTVVITDKLDDGVDYVSSTEGGVYDSATHTVTWTLTVDPFTTGSVTVTVEVNSSAVTQVENTASVKIGNEDAVDTNTVENPLEEEVVTEPVPTTSDTEAVVPYTIMMLMAFVAIVALLKGRRREEQA